MSAKNAELAKFLAHWIFELGHNHGALPVNRMQFMHGKTPERPGGGLCEGAMADHLELALERWQASPPIAQPGEQVDDDLLDVAAMLENKLAYERNLLESPNGGGSRIAVGRHERWLAAVRRAIAALQSPRAEDGRDAKLWALLPNSAAYLDPPDGGDVSLIEQLRRMSVDARRYRWLREQTAEDAMSVECWNDERTRFRRLAGSKLDAAIDTAMPQGQKEGGA
jgi:hypothetical protein